MAVEGQIQPFDRVDTAEPAPRSESQNTSSASWSSPVASGKALRLTPPSPVSYHLIERLIGFDRSTALLGAALSHSGQAIAAIGLANVLSIARNGNRGSPVAARSALSLARNRSIRWRSGP